MTTERKKKVNKLISEVNKGNKESLIELYEIMSPSIRYIALKYLKNEDDAQDMVQDFWADIYKICASIGFLSNGFGYLCRVMERKTITRYKYLKREREIVFSFVDYADIKLYSEQNVIDAETRMEITKIINSLPDIERFIIQETYFADKTVRQIAKELKISKSKVSILKNKAIDFLKKNLEKF